MNDTENKARKTGSDCFNSLFLISTIIEISKFFLLSLPNLNKLLSRTYLCLLVQRAVQSV